MLQEKYLWIMKNIQKSIECEFACLSLCVCVFLPICNRRVGMLKIKMCVDSHPVCLRCVFSLIHVSLIHQTNGNSQGYICNDGRIQLSWHLYKKRGRNTNTHKERNGESSWQSDGIEIEIQFKCMKTTKMKLMHLPHVHTYESTLSFLDGASRDPNTKYNDKISDVCLFFFHSGSLQTWKA